MPRSSYPGGGTITRVDEGRWLVQVFLGRDPHGKQLRHKKTVHGSRTDAELHLLSVLAEKARRRSARKPTLNNFLDQWLHTVARQKLSLRTFQDYEEILRRYVRDGLGREPLESIQSMHLQELYANLSQDRGLAPPTVRKLHAVLSGALKQAVRWRLIPHNIARDVDLPKQRAVRKRVLAMTAEQVHAFLAAAQGTRWEPLFHFAFTTGMRPEEYLALAWSHVDFTTDTVRVERVLIRSRVRSALRPPCEPAWYFDKPKTPASARSVVLPAGMMARLKTHKARQNEERLSCGEGYEDHGLVFADPRGEPLETCNLLRRHFRPLLAKAGLPSRFNLYSARHTMATLLLAAGENAKVISERLGHASVVHTLDTYASVLPSMQRGAAERLEAVIYG